MNTADIESKVLQSLYDIVPEAEGEAIRQNIYLREQFDLDSIDFLNFITKIHQNLGLDIPESDYRYLTTLSNIVAYLSTKINKNTENTVS